MAGKKDSQGTIEERLRIRYEVDPVSGCWNWTGALSAGKYGSIYYEGGMKKAHRVSWILKNGPVPEGMDLDHLCRNKKCCNPDHLEPVTRSVNLARSPLMDRKSSTTHCPKGHEYSGENLKLTTKGYRVCRTCAIEKTRLWRAEKVEMKND